MSGGPYDSDLSDLNMGLPDLRMTVIACYIVYDLHHFMYFYVSYVIIFFLKFKT